jgi:lactose/L-arabinose transport system permease protein
MGGFGFAKYEFRGKNPLFTLLIGSMMIPFWVYVVPLYVFMIKIGWINTYQALIIPWVGSAFGTFLCRQYMLSLPSELLDAARIDGASEIRILVQIALPLARPALGAVAIVLFLSSWNSFFWPLVILRDQARYTIPVGLALLSNMNVGQREWGPLMAGSVLASLPIIMVFLFMQRQFISGMVAGAVKM